jgi:gas vesicle protein
MKAQFYLGVGLGVAAGAAGALLMKPREKDLKKALGSARQTLDQAMRKIGG